ncbi:hypothetical protein AYM40_20850 [Paraburkholderia phytofirmans OLGA172]|uniref:Calcineurin-like phosphoesterase domain-containing protein n=1 Tax=Paraburkholderia phytofirmans OLGA172 TaxID=1417228 RepID=A0A160FQC8_9BURK|nr:metallophosphoesterase family protein [Paraburkholderia phytofirmans]ANB74902.1 hypothetical protein AYM40_20850 [Paraburkholderia phytofirmans OLGA172]
MRLHIVSDLHQHSSRDAGPDPRVTPVDADVLILAGDIDFVEKVADRYGEWPYDVLYVRGNHDTYFRPYERAISTAAIRMETGRVRMLERRVVFYPKIRIVGCCLWTDFELVGNVEDVIVLNRELGADFRCLMRADGRSVTPEDLRVEHRSSLEWLQNTLREPFNGVNVVVSHHAPHRRSLNPAYGVTWSSASFASDLSATMRHVSLWVHGHVHSFVDFKFKRCRVVCNAAGSTARPNPDFVSDFVVEI